MPVVKKHESQGKIVVSIVDDVLIGKILTEGKAILDLNSDFYKGEKITEDEALTQIEGADSLVVVGTDSIELILSVGLIEKTEFKKICSVPYEHVALIN